jgi:hypothetical protein
MVKSDNVLHKELVYGYIMSSKKFILNSTLLISLKHLKIPKVVLNKKWRSLI